MIVQVENAQNGFIVRNPDGDPVVVADFGQCINVLMQASMSASSPEAVMMAFVSDWKAWV